jgi:hypothetical protein
MEKCRELNVGEKFKATDKFCGVHYWEVIAKNEYPERESDYPFYDFKLILESKEERTKEYYQKGYSAERLRECFSLDEHLTIEDIEHEWLNQRTIEIINN